MENSITVHPNWGSYLKLQIMLDLCIHPQLIVMGEIKVSVISIQMHPA